jgi:hypothetical protein
MKFATIAAAGSLFVGTALAAKAADNIQDIVSKLPQCARDCLPDAIGDSCKSNTDYDCACENYGAVTLSLTNCMTSSILSGDCSISDINDLTDFSESACTDFDQDDVNDINSVLSSLGVTSGLADLTSALGSATADLPGLTSLVGSATSKIGDLTASTTVGPTQTGDSDSDSDSSSETDSPGAGPMITPMAWAGAAAVVAAFAL